MHRLLKQVSITVPNISQLIKQYVWANRNKHGPEQVPPEKKIIDYTYTRWFSLTLMKPLSFFVIKNLPRSEPATYIPRFHTHSSAIHTQHTQLYLYFLRLSWSLLALFSIITGPSYSLMSNARISTPSENPILISEFSERKMVKSSERGLIKVTSGVFGCKRIWCLFWPSGDSSVGWEPI